jgi:hypothetical protein
VLCIAADSTEKINADVLQCSSSAPACPRCSGNRASTNKDAQIRVSFPLHFRIFEIKSRNIVQGLLSKDFFSVLSPGFAYIASMVRAKQHRRKAVVIVGMPLI